MSKFGQNFDQIWSLSKFQNHSQVSTCYDQQNLNYGPKKLMQSRIIKIIQFFSSIFKTYRIIFLSTTHKQGTSQVKSMVMNYTVTHPVRLLTSRIHQEILVTLWSMQYVECSVRYVVCSLQYIECSIQNVVYSMQYTVYGIPSRK